MTKRYLISGVTSGIGKAVAEKLLKLGNQVFGIGRNGDKIEDLMSQYPDDLVFCSFNLNETFAEVPGLSDFVKEKGKFNGLMYCAGIEETLPISLYSPERLQTIMNVNFTAPFQLLKILSKKKMSENESSFVFISSVMGELGQPGKTGYCSSKAAILGLVRAAALELAPRKIRVNAISPGVVETPMTAKLFEQIGEEGKQKTLAMHPLGFGRLDDIVPLIEFLISDDSRWITGQNIKIDGGYSIQ